MIAENITLNQRTIARVLNSSPSTVNRVLNSNEIASTFESEGGKVKRYDLVKIQQVARLILKNEMHPIVNKTSIFYNFKGGTGKTSLCFQTATHLAIMGYKVLAIDLDPQGHLSNAMGIGENINHFTMYDILINGMDINKAILPVCEGLDIIPANISMTRIEVPLSSKTKREEKLRLVLEPIKDQYDFILIDTNPTISTLNLNALVAADRINVVCETQPFSLSGLRVLVDEMLQFYDDMGIIPNFGIIANKYEAKTALSQEVLGTLRTEYKNHVMDSVVRKCEDINIAAKKRLPVCVFCGKNSSALEDILDLVYEFIKVAQNKSDILNHDGLAA